MNHILRTRPLWYRKSCGSCLRGLYFTCSYCFDSHGDTTYDLCPDCYCKRRFGQHHHEPSSFVDSYSLLDCSNK
ncbi:hypothetical protein I3760_02G106000 [Carya illinoinensis]|nr:hypothetical protein I3760_02G106000 [Carya illinoinensis]